MECVSTAVFLYLTIYVIDISFQIIPFGDSVAVRHGIILSTLERSGNVIGPDDMEIAAITLADDAVLVTHNTGEFSRINGLKIEDWTE